MHKRNVRFARVRIVKNRVAGAEGPARTVLAGQSDRDSFQQKRTKSERLGVLPLIGAAGLKNLALMVDHDALYFRLHVETLRYSRQRIDNRLQYFLADCGRFRLAAVLWLKNRSRFSELCLFASFASLDRFHLFERHF